MRDSWGGGGDWRQSYTTDVTATVLLSLVVLTWHDSVDRQVFNRLALSKNPDVLHSRRLLQSLKHKMLSALFEEI